MEAKKVSVGLLVILWVSECVSLIVGSGRFEERSSDHIVWFF